VGKKILYLINIISGIVFCVSISEWMTSSIIFSLFLGLILGIIEYLFLTRFHPRFNKVLLVVSLAGGGLISFLSAKNFYDTWITSLNFVRTVVTKVFPDYDQGLLIISIVVGIMTLPFAACMIGMLPTLVKVFRKFEYKEIWSKFKEKLTLRTILRKAGIVTANLITAVIMGTLLLFAVYLLPTERIEVNVASSAQTIADEGLDPSLFSWITSDIDTFTDSLMLLEAAYPQDASPLADAMNVPRGGLGESDPVDTIVGHYVNGADYDLTNLYPRYWHGYLIFLKPLLQLFDYSDIRLINGVIQTLIVLITCFLLFKKEHKKAVIPYLFSHLMLMPIALAKAFQYSSCFYIFSFVCIALLIIKNEKRKTLAPLVFLWSGIATAYFDLLTYPISTFGVPMVLYLLLDNTNSTESKLAEIVRNAIYWCFGLGAMWVSKWCIASIITGENKFTDALSKVAQRTSMSSDDGGTYSIYATEIRNFGAFIRTPITVLVVLLIIYMIFKLIKQKNLTAEESVRLLFPFLLTGLAPVVWYAFATNHSMIHYWFTNKACVTSLLAVLFGMACLLEANTKKMSES